MISVFGSNTGKEEIREVSDSINKNWLGMGPKVKEFERAIMERLKLSNFLMVDSGSNALYLAIKCLDLPLGSEVILPSFTWVSCAQAIILAGCKPVFCDVDYHTQNVTLDTISPHINSKTGAIMVVHYAGKPVDLYPILKLNIPIVEDAAHAIDSTYKGKACGSIGEVGIYSFDGVKNIACGMGGGITFKKEQSYIRAKKLRYSGIEKSGFSASQTTDSNGKWWEYNISEVFIKMLPSDIMASIGLAQLKKLDSNQKIRKQIWKTYEKAFSSIDSITTPQNEEYGEKHSYFTYFLKVENRNKLANYLLEKKIYTTLRYHPLHLNKIYNSNKRLPNSEKLNVNGLNIPLHPKLEPHEIEYVIKNITEFYN